MEKLIFYLLFIYFGSGEDIALFKTVNTSSGPMKGYFMNGLYVWLGIPFAKPPIGDLRFKKPEPFPKLEKVFEADKQPNACVQFPGQQYIRPMGEREEDCLYLNIHTPENVSESCPVVIWIDGGGYTVGAASIEQYDPTIFTLISGIIFISIQYRLGSLGFLYTGKNATGNMGLYDQSLAIKWVHDNIKGFGGDPNQITLMGQSAGANSVAIHIMSNITNQYFQKAILQSSGYDVPWGIIKHTEAIERAKALGKRVECKDFRKLEECLREIDAHILISQEYYVKKKGMLNDFPFVPVVDGRIVPDDPVKTLKDILEGKTKIKKKLPILLGSNVNEGYISLAEILPKIYNLKIERTEQQMILYDYQFSYYFRTVFQDYSLKVQEEIKNQYPNDGTDSFYFRVFDQIAADYSYVCSLEKFAEANAYSGNEVYRYYYDHHSSNDWAAKWTGTKHGDELEFIFGLPLSGIRRYPPEELAFAWDIVNIWSQFIKSGNPGKERYGWPVYEAPYWTYLHLSVSKSMLCSFDLNERCKFWIYKFPELVKKYPNQKDLFPIRK